jgi:ligand-binding sensor domain-containing protein/two-component sensor histidine kinase
LIIGKKLFCQTNTQISYNFQKVNLAFSKHKIKSIVQQSNSYLWVGTEGGLFRYDGQNYKQYSYRKSDKNPVSPIINDLCISYKNKVWIATADGISVLDPIQDTFKHFLPANYPELSTSVTNHIFEDSDKTIWVGLDNRDPLYYDESQDTFISIGWKQYIIENNLDVRKYNCVNTIKNKSKDEIWICSNVGLYSYHKITKQFSHYHKNINWNSPIEFSDLYCQDKKSVFLNTTGDGFAIYHLDTKQWEYHKASPLSNVLSDDHKRWSILPFGDRKLWVASSVGLIEYNLDNHKSTLLNDFVSHDEHNPNWMIFNIFKGDDEVMWLGGLNGMWKLDPRFQCIQKLHIDLKEKNITAIYKDSLHQNIYFACKQKGSFYCYQVPTAKLYEMTCPSAVDMEYSSKIIPYQRFLWIYSATRLVLFDTRTQCFVFDMSKYFSKRKLFFTSMIVDSKGKIYCGVFDVGLLRLDFDYDKFEIIKQDTLHKASDITDIILENENLLICDHSSVIYQFNLVSKQKSAVLDISHDSISSSSLIFRIKRDENGNLWMITRPNGLWCFTKDHAVLNFSKEEPIVSTIFLDFETLPKGKLILRNSQQLFIFDSYNNRLSSFDAHYGIDFTDGTSQLVVMEDGSILTGVKNGILLFHPDSLASNTILYQAFISDLFVNNRWISPNNYKGPLQFGYQENNIEITPSLLNWDPMQSMKLEYQLTWNKQDTGWHVLQSLQPIQLRALQPGEYTFSLRTINNKGEYLMAKENLKFRINKHYMQTWWFKTIVLLFLLSLFYAYYKIKINELIRIQNLKNKVANDLHDDIASTITSIGFYSDFAIKKAKQDDQIKSLLETINKNAKEATESLRDIVWTMHNNEESMGQLIDKINSTGRKLCEAKQVMFSFQEQNMKKDLILNQDAKKVFYLSFKEALNNALKYSHCTEVKVMMITKNNEISMTVEDDGCGFDKISIRKGRGLNSIEERSKALLGKVIISSEINKGTTILFSLLEKVVKK